MVKFFGKIDLNQKGNIAAQKPAWSFERHIDDMKETIDRKKRELERGSIPPDFVVQQRAEIEREESRLREILESRPKLSDVEKDAATKVGKSLGKKIEETLFTRDDMFMGFASPHEEARRMKQPIIKLDEKEYEFCRENGVKITKKDDGYYTTRDGASKMYKFIKNYFGESGNVEELRKGKLTVGRGRVGYTGA